MQAVISKRVNAGPRDPLPPGAAEAEFAYRASRLVRGELPEPVPVESTVSLRKHSEHDPLVEVAINDLSAIERPDNAIDASLHAIAVLERMTTLGNGISNSDAANILGVDADYAKKLRRRDFWRTVRWRKGKHCALFSIEDVLVTARKRHAELVRCSPKCA